METNFFLSFPFLTTDRLVSSIWLLMALINDFFSFIFTSNFYLFDWISGNTTSFNIAYDFFMLSRAIFSVNLSWWIVFILCFLFFISVSLSSVVCSVFSRVDIFLDLSSGLAIENCALLFELPNTELRISLPPFSLFYLLLNRSYSALFYPCLDLLFSLFDYARLRCGLSY